MLCDQSLYPGLISAILFNNGHLTIYEPQYPHNKSSYFIVMNQVVHEK